jgi:carbamoyl-phosphate synthase large subunit
VYKITVLVTSAGVASAVNIIKSFRLQKELDIEIIAADVDKLAAGLYLADEHYVSPPITNKEKYLDFLCGLCEQYRVNALFPCYSKELSIVSGAEAAFHRIGTSMLLPPPDAIDLCNDKEHIALHVEKLGIPVPTTFRKPGGANLPLFSKLLEGSSSIGALYVDSIHLLNHLLCSGETRIYQEFIRGTEYTVDVLCDRDSKVLFAGPRKRLATKAGQSVKGISVQSDILHEYVERICRSVGIIGVCNIQFVESNGKYYFIELNPRYAAGGLMLTVNAGANLPLAALKLMLGLPVGKLEHIPNMAMTRYWEEIYIEGQS